MKSSFNFFSFTDEAYKKLSLLSNLWFLDLCVAQVYYMTVLLFTYDSPRKNNLFFSFFLQTEYIWWKPFLYSQMQKYSYPQFEMVIYINHKYS